MDDGLRMEHDLMSCSLTLADLMKGSSCLRMNLMTTRWLLSGGVVDRLVVGLVVLVVVHPLVIVQPDNGKHNGGHVELAACGGGQ